MPQHIKGPTVVAAAGNMSKLIQEIVGRANSSTDSVSIARMMSPGGWTEPGQRPDFDEYTIVLKGALLVRTEDGTAAEVREGDAFIARKGEWVQYSTPGRDGAEYIAVCIPAFSPATVHRDEP
jgi:uncharacterized cupin superfamily protein